MGRSIPAVTSRLDSKISQWNKFSRLLPPNERDAFLQLITLIKNRRTAIGEADEADIGVAILLAISTHLKDELCSVQKQSSRA